MTAPLIGDARCSTDQQDLTAQREGLVALGVVGNRIPSGSLHAWPSSDDLTVKDLEHRAYERPGPERNPTPTASVSTA